MSDQLRERIARALHDHDHPHCTVGWGGHRFAPTEEAFREMADAVLAELGLEQVGWYCEADAPPHSHARSRGGWHSRSLRFRNDGEDFCERSVPVYIMREDTDE